MKTLTTIFLTALILTGCSQLNDCIEGKVQQVRAKEATLMLEHLYKLEELFIMECIPILLSPLASNMKS